MDNGGLRRVVSVCASTGRFVHGSVLVSLLGGTEVAASGGVRGVFGNRFLGLIAGGRACLCDDGDAACFWDCSLVEISRMVGFENIRCRNCTVRLSLQHS